MVGAELLTEAQQPRSRRPILLGDLPILSTCPPSLSTTTPLARTAPTRHPARSAWTGPVAWLCPRSLLRSATCPSARSSSWTAAGDGCSPACSRRGGSAWRCRSFSPLGLLLHIPPIYCIVDRRNPGCNRDACKILSRRTTSRMLDQRDGRGCRYCRFSSAPTRSLHVIGMEWNH